MYFSYSTSSSTASSAASSYSSYSSNYSSYSSSSAALDISKSSKNEYSQSSCAFPSWPRRESLEGSNNRSGSSFSGVANSYISDDDLFPDVFEDETESPLSNISSPCRSPQVTALPDRYHRNVEVIDLWASAAAVRAEKQARKQQRRSSSKKQSKSSSKTMTPIREAE